MSQAIADPDTVAFTVWLDTLTALVAENNELLKGKVVVDPTNPLKLDANGMLQLGRPQRSQLPSSPYDVSSATSSCSGSHCSSPSATRSRGVGWRSPLSATPRFYAETMLDRVLSELVIDDVHELVSDGAQAHVSRLLAVLPESVHAVLGNASRSSVAPSSTPTYWRADLRLGRCKGKGRSHQHVDNGRGCR